MNKIIVVFLGIMALSVAFLYFGSYNNDNKKVTPISQSKTEKVDETKFNMKIVSAAFNHNAKIPAKYTCDEENINPPLQFLDVPENAKSLVLIVDDPDAPSKTWTHWVVYNIDSQTSEVKKNSVPEGGTEGVTDFGKPGYGGPCPPASPKLQRGEPSGVHRYFFKLYALDIILDLAPNATKQMVEEKMQGHIIDRTELIGLYSRS